VVGELAAVAVADAAVAAVAPVAVVEQRTAAVPSSLPQAAAQPERFPVESGISWASDQKSPSAAAAEAQSRRPWPTMRAPEPPASYRPKKKCRWSWWRSSGSPGDSMNAAAAAAGLSGGRN
jgi:hypothetical protein